MTSAETIDGREVRMRTFDTPKIEAVEDWLRAEAKRIAGLEAERPVWLTTKLGESSTGTALATNRFHPMSTHWDAVVASAEVRVRVHTFYQGHVLASLHLRDDRSPREPQRWFVENAFRPFDRWG